jgi:general secretion pathway protein A
MAKKDPRRALLLRNLGFQEEPFTRSADPRFLYLSSQHGQVLNSLQEIIDDRRGLAVVEGGYGMGKSTLARRLEDLHRLHPDDYSVVFVHTSDYESEYAGLLDLSYALNLHRRKGKTMQWREFETFLVDERESERNVVIILDDAQLMSAKALTLIHHIYNFDVRGKLAQLILFGQPEIQFNFAMHPEIRSRVDSWFSLNPLSLEDTLNLILYRCRVAGRGESILAQDAAIELYNVTHGVPREIVGLCARILDVMSENSEEVASSITVIKAIEDFQEYHSQRPDVMGATEDT